jgi:hypothetical protein
LLIKWVPFPMWGTMLNIFLYLLKHKWQRKSINDIILEWTRDLDIEENTIAKNIERFNKKVCWTFPEYKITSKNRFWYQIWDWIHKEIYAKKFKKTLIKISWNWQCFWVLINDDPMICFELSNRSYSTFIEILKWPTKPQNRVIISNIRQKLREVWLWEIVQIKPASEGFYYLEMHTSTIKNTRSEVKDLLDWNWNAKKQAA